MNEKKRRSLWPASLPKNCVFRQAALDPDWGRGACPHSPSPSPPAAPVSSASGRGFFDSLPAVFEALFAAVLLTGFTGTFLSLYANGTLPHPFAPCLLHVRPLCAAAAGCAFLLALLRRLPRFSRTARGGAFALFLAYVLRTLPALRRSARPVALYFTNVLDVWRKIEWGGTARQRSLPSASPVPFLLCALVLLAFLLEAALACRLTALAVLCTLAPLAPGLLARFSPDALPFLVLCACWCALAFASLCRRQAAPYARQLALGLGASLALLAALWALLPQAAYRRPAWAQNAARTLLQAGSAPQDGAPETPDAHRAPAYVFTGTADLAHAGPLSYRGACMLRVTGAAEGRLYLRGVSFSDYADGVWHLRAAPVFADADESPFTLPARSDPTAVRRTVTVENVAAPASLLYLPYYPAPQDWAAQSATVQGDACLTVSGARGAHTVVCADARVRARPGARTGLTATWDAPAADGTTTLSETDYRDYVLENYREVPDELRELLRTDPGLAALDVPAADTPLETARAVADALGALCVYDARTEAAPASTDPVVWFLTESRRGYCMHFASAAVLILRTMGIPARYVSGYAVHAGARQTVEVPDRAAHAWVEVWLDGFGWAPAEVTPAAAFDWYERGLNMADATQESPSAASSGSSSAPASESGSAASESAGGSGASSGAQQDVPDDRKAQADRSALRLLVKILAGTAGLAALLWLGGTLPKEVRARHMRGPDRNRAALACYRYLLQLHRFGGRVPEEATALAQKARFSSHVLTDAELGTLRALYDAERARLAGCPPVLRRLVCRFFFGKPDARH